ncbi:MAG: glycosyltransferase family 2 protein [Anaerolineae bacterium]|nr:glycosyltransferase family 2 protein [Anaerolineae bacterium]
MVSTTSQTRQQPLVSVVTPVYNTEKYLAECIESVLAQSYDNWEYVIINNCSTDRSLEIAQRYAAQDSRITIHNNTQFLSQMQNWNHAMRQISPDSRYCKVVHADDWLFPDCIAHMVTLAEQYPSVGIVGAYRLDEVEVDMDGLPYPSPCVSGRDMCRRALLDGHYMFGSPTSTLLRSDLVRQRDPFYDEAKIHADTAVCFALLQESDFGFVHQVLTFTRRHNESVTSIMGRFRTTRISRLEIVKEYGSAYLSPQEYKQTLQKHIDAYYYFLARKALEFQNKEFWDYHKRELARLGIEFDNAHLMKCIFYESLNFRDTFKTVKRNLRRRGAAAPKTGRRALVEKG